MSMGFELRIPGLLGPSPTEYQSRLPDSRLHSRQPDWGLLEAPDKHLYMYICVFIPTCLEEMRIRGK